MLSRQVAHIQAIQGCPSLTFMVVIACYVLQTWDQEWVQFGDGEHYDRQVLQNILIDDEKHRIRSGSAEASSAAAASNHPLPPGTAGGGQKSADPNSRAEVLLTGGELPTLSYNLQCAWYALSAACDRILVQLVHLCGPDDTIRQTRSTRSLEAGASMPSRLLACAATRAILFSMILCFEKHRNRC